MDSMSLFLSSVVPALTGDHEAQPFDTHFWIPLEAARQATFFAEHYRNEEWRTIDTGWLDSSSTVARQLDSSTNNTSLVLAFDLAGGEAASGPGLPDRPLCIRLATMAATTLPCAKTRKGAGADAESADGLHSRR